MIAFAALGTARTTRQGRGAAIMAAIVHRARPARRRVRRVQPVGAQRGRRPLVYALPLGGHRSARFLRLRPAPDMARRLSHALQLRGAAGMIVSRRSDATSPCASCAAIGAVFATLFMLIYLARLRRAAAPRRRSPSAPARPCWPARAPAHARRGRTGPALRRCWRARCSPSSDLSRKLELVVARAAGVSVWQFLVAAPLIVLLLGVFATTVYNPVSASLKQRAAPDRDRACSAARAASRHELWIRQRSLDGQAIIRAERSSDGGTRALRRHRLRVTTARAASSSGSRPRGPAQPASGPSRTPGSSAPGEEPQVYADLSYCHEPDPRAGHAILRRTRPSVFWSCRS